MSIEFHRNTGCYYSKKKQNIWIKDLLQYLMQASTRTRGCNASPYAYITPQIRRFLIKQEHAGMGATGLKTLIQCMDGILEIQCSRC